MRRPANIGVRDPLRTALSDSATRTSVIPRRRPGTPGGLTTTVPPQWWPNAWRPGIGARFATAAGIDRHSGQHGGACSRARRSPSIASVLGSEWTRRSGRTGRQRAGHERVPTRTGHPDFRARADPSNPRAYRVRRRRVRCAASCPRAGPRPALWTRHAGNRGGGRRLGRRRRSRRETGLGLPRFRRPPTVAPGSALHAADPSGWSDSKQRAVTVPVGISGVLVRPPALTVRPDAAGRRSRHRWPIIMIAPITLLALRGNQCSPAGDGNGIEAAVGLTAAAPAVVCAPPVPHAGGAPPVDHGG